MKRFVIMLLAMFFATSLLATDAMAKGGVSSSSSSRGGSFSSSGSKSYSSGSRSSSGSKISSAPKYSAKSPKPVTYGGKTYTPPPKTSRFKSTPYYGKPGYGSSYHNLSNFWLWAAVFHTTSYDDDCDTTGYEPQALSDGCEYAYEYGGRSNYDAGGWVLFIGGVFAVIVLGVIGFTALTRRL